MRNTKLRKLAVIVFKSVAKRDTGKTDFTGFHGKTTSAVSDLQMEEQSVLCMHVS